MFDPRRIPVSVLTALAAVLCASSPGLRRAWGQTDETAVHQGSAGAGEELTDEDFDESAEDEGDAEPSEVLNPDVPVMEDDDAAPDESELEGEPDADEAEMAVEEDREDEAELGEGEDEAPEDEAAPSAAPANMGEGEEELMQGDEDSDEEDEDEALETAADPAPSPASKPAASKPSVP